MYVLFQWGCSLCIFQAAVMTAAGWQTMNSCYSCFLVRTTNGKLIINWELFHSYSIIYGYPYITTRIFFQVLSRKANSYIMNYILCYSIGRIGMNPILYDYWEFCKSYKNRIIFMFVVINVYLSILQYCLQHKQNTDRSECDCYKSVFFFFFVTFLVKMFFLFL